MNIILKKLQRFQWILQFQQMAFAKSSSLIVSNSVKARPVRSLCVGIQIRECFQASDSLPALWGCLKQEDGNDVSYQWRPQHWRALAFAQNPRHQLGSTTVNIISTTFALLSQRSHPHLAFGNLSLYMLPQSVLVFSILSIKTNIYEA